ncbi:MAG: CRTAC1 family protein [Bryobacterales bacterium]|nr:CRTAC1 family protein [Bryobacterales bacterium]
MQLVCTEGLNFVLRHSPTAQKYLVETMTGGVALLDYDRDGRLDLFLVNGGKLDDAVRPPLRLARHHPNYWNRLYRQQPDGQFIDVTVKAGLARAGESNYGMGTAVGDYNNDGYPDLYVTNFGHNQLYRNNGDGTFTDVTAEAGVHGGGWSVSAGFFDYDRDGWLDLFVSRYLDWDFTRNLHCGTPFRAYCRPDRYHGTTNLLYRNLGNGRFQDVSQQAGIATPVGKGMGVAFLDYDRDGFPDIFVSNDGMEQFLYRNLGDGRFQEVALEAGAALSDDGRPYAGMGVAAGDYDNDGWPDVLVTNLALEHWALYRNEGQGRFRYVSRETGLAAISASSSGWGAGLYDFDNDGWKDLFVARSHVLDNVERIHSGLRYKEPAGLLWNRGGRFVLEDLKGAPAVAGRGAAFGDLNNDGAMDVVMTALGERPQIFLNRRRGNHWLTVRLVGTRSNRDGLGAKVRVAGQWAEATTAGSYLSASDARVHFGLGERARVDVEIEWPSGRRQLLAGVAANQILEVREP